MTSFYWRQYATREELLTLAVERGYGQCPYIYPTTQNVDSHLVATSLKHIQILRSKARIFRLSNRASDHQIYHSRSMTAVATGYTRKNPSITYTFARCTVVSRIGQNSTKNATSMIINHINHLRRLSHAYTCGSHLAPGGYIEQAEVSPAPKCDDGSIVPGDPLDQCGKLAISAGTAFGKSLMIEETMEDDIRKAGFTDVVRYRFKWPFGAWSNDQRLKELGTWNLIMWNRGLEGWTLRFFTKHMGVRDISLPLLQDLFPGFMAS